MFIRIKQQIVELLEEEPTAEAGNGFMIALGILILAFGVSAAIFASVF